MVGINENLDAPNLNEAEVTLIGGTSGYGETIIIHIGYGIWAVVDSCTNPNNGECVALEYLNEIGVNVKEQLKYVICSHWHDDHIRGLSNLIDACSNKTIFAMSSADNRELFINEMLDEMLDYKNIVYSPKLTELRNTIKKINEKKIKIKRVEQDHMIFNKNGIECFALSPSAIETEKFNREIANAHVKYQKVINQISKLKKINYSIIEDANSIEKETMESFENLISDKFVIDSEYIKESENLLKYKDVKKVKLNNRCVAMLLKIKRHCVVLGADLEHNQNKVSEGGWQSVSDCECMDNVQANLFKIPHHGSETGYYDFFLKKHIKKDAVSKLTSWVIGTNFLPKADMLRKYYNHSKNLYLTSTTDLLQNKNKEKDPTFRKIMNNTTEEILEYKPLLGIIRSRINIDSNDDTWQTAYFGSARRIEKVYLDSLC